MAVTLRHIANTDEGSVLGMTSRLSLVSLLGKELGPARLPDLGERELGVMDLLWQHGALTCQGALDFLADSEISLSTVQSTFERLHRKNLVHREKVGRSFVYTAELTRENVISRLMHDIADSLANGDSTPMVSGFLDYLDEDEDTHPGLRRIKRASR